LIIKEITSSARVGELESQVSASQREHDKLVEDFNNEMAALKRKSRSEMDSERQELNRKISSLTKESEMLKAEVVFFKYLNFTNNNIIQSSGVGKEGNN
jgi:Skp family chaperone for outer membrane proteins